MIQVNVHEAKTRLSELLKAVEDGEEVVIARAGVPVAHLAPIADDASARMALFGAWKDRIVLTPEFDEPLPPDVFPGIAP